MHNNKLFTILKHFDKSEFRQLDKYLNSPYFNKSKQLIQFFSLLEKQINSKKNSSSRSLGSELFSKEKLWKKLFPGQKYNDVRFRKLSSDLLKLVEGFLAQQIYDSNLLQKSAYLIEAVGSKGIEKLNRSALKGAEYNSNKNPYTDSSFYLNQYLIQKSYYELIQHEYKHSLRHNLEEIDEFLNKFYLSEKMRYYCAVLSQEQRGTHKYDLKFLDQVIEIIKNNNVEDIPALAIYYQIYLTYIEEKNEDHYFKLKQLLKEHGLKFQSIEAKSLYDSAINYCAKKLNQGNTNFLQEMFDVYEDYLGTGLIYIDGELDPFHFRNIITISLRLGKFNWTENFIHKNKDRLPKSSKENAVTFNLARLYYYKKDYDQVISLLQEVEYENMVYNLSSKSLLIATYYEIDEIDALYSLFESFRTYLNRRKDITEGWKRPYLNLIRFAKKLTKVIPGDKTAVQKIKHEIDNYKQGIANVEWLKEKIAELE